jgi:hypothetical protein
LEDDDKTTIAAAAVYPLSPTTVYRGVLVVTTQPTSALLTVSVNSPAYPLPLFTSTTYLATGGGQVSWWVPVPLAPDLAYSVEIATNNPQSGPGRVTIYGSSIDLSDISGFQEVLPVGGELVGTGLWTPPGPASVLVAAGAGTAYRLHLVTLDGATVGDSAWIGLASGGPYFAHLTVGAQQTIALEGQVTGGPVVADGTGSDQLQVDLWYDLIAA